MTNDAKTIRPARRAAEPKADRVVIVIGRPLRDWPYLEPALAAAGEGGGHARGRCAAAGCKHAPRVFLGEYGFCRNHWPRARRWWDGGAKPPATDLHELYNRHEARVYVNERLVAQDARPLSEGTFLKRLYEDLYPTMFGLEPLRLGTRRVGLTDETHPAGGVLVFTRRLLNTFVQREAAGHMEPARPTASEREDLFVSSEASAWLNAWWAERGVRYIIHPRLLLYYRMTGRIPAVTLSGQTDVYIRRDLEALAMAIADAGGWDERPRRGPRPKSGR